MEKQTDGVNSIKLSGEIAYPPETRTSKKGNLWGFGKLKTSGKGGFLIGFITWHKDCAEQLSRLRDRDQVTLHGELGLNVYEKKDGTKAYEHRIIVDQIDVHGPSLGWKQPERTNWPEKPAKSPEPYIPPELSSDFDDSAPF